MYVEKDLVTLLVHQGLSSEGHCVKKRTALYCYSKITVVRGCFSLLI